MISDDFTGHAGKKRQRSKGAARALPGPKESRGREQGRVRRPEMSGKERQGGGPGKVGNS